jgi:hypothetical protein
LETRAQIVNGNPMAGYTCNPLLRIGNCCRSLKQLCRTKVLDFKDLPKSPGQELLLLAIEFLARNGAGIPCLLQVNQLLPHGGAGRTAAIANANNATCVEEGG